MNKCLGCGITLQSTDPNAIGFAKNSNLDLCERCFRIQNYNDYKRVIKDNNSILKLFSAIKSTDLVVLVVDIMGIPENFKLLQNLPNEVLVVFSKADLLPSEMYEAKLNKILANLGLKFVDKILISAKNNYNLDALMLKIRSLKKSNDVYFIGFSNSGKSTLINKIIYNYTDKDSKITTSLLPSTTLDLITIEVAPDLKIIDTPGLLEEGNLLDFLEVKDLKKVILKTKIKPRVYQIKARQVLNIDDILMIMVANTNLTIFISNSLKITREYDKEIEGLDFKLAKSEELVIPGLGFIQVNKETTLNLKTKYPVKCYIRNKLI